jgi:hypothetical protein
MPMTMQALRCQGNVPRGVEAGRRAVDGLVLQRKCACGESSRPSGQCEDCRKNKPGTLQRAVVGHAPTGGVPPIVHDVLQSPGQPLDAATRAYMEPRFDHDFSRVRVHADGAAAASARSVDALAYTSGSNVVFGEGQFAPESTCGRRLLAHELAHVIQQSDAGASHQPDRVGAPDDPLERQAEHAAARVSAGMARSIALDRRAPGIQRQAVPTGITLKEAKPFGHGDLKSDEVKKKFRTYVGSTTLMQVSPAGDYKGHCVKEYLTEVANTCPARFAELRKEAFCTESKCLDFDRYGSAGDPETGKLVTDGPDSFLDRHRTRHPESLLEGTGKNECSVVCHQRYAFDRKTDLGSFYIIRNFQAGKFLLPDKTALHVTTGEVRKVTAALAAPSTEKFAKDIAPGLVKSKDLVSPPPVPATKGKPAVKDDK